MHVFRTKIRGCSAVSKISAVAIAFAFGFLLFASSLFCSASASEEEPAPVTISAAPAPAETDNQSPFVAIPQQFQTTASKEDLRRRPLLYFRMWANKPLPLVPSFLFLFFITVVASEIMPARMEVARRYYASHYWRSLWSGIVACLLFTTSARALFASEIGVPLAVVSLAALEFFVLVGATISSTLVGQTILSVLNPKRASASGRQWFQRLAVPLVGSLLLSLLLIIPPLGILPRIGIRLIMLLSCLGMGAWFRTGMGTKEMGNASEM